MKKRKSYDVLYDAEGKERLFEVDESTMCHNNFEVLSNKLFVELLKKTDDSLCVLIAYMLKYKNVDNIVIDRVEKISDRSGLSVSTCKRLIKKLIDIDFLARVEDCVYMINPAIVMRGSKYRKVIMCSCYERAKKKKTTAREISLEISEKVSSEAVSQPGPKGPQKGLVEDVAVVTASAAESSVCKGIKKKWKTSEKVLRKIRGPQKYVQTGRRLFKVDLLTKKSVEVTDEYLKQKYLVD